MINEKNVVNYKAIPLKGIVWLYWKSQYHIENIILRLERIRVKTTYFSFHLLLHRKRSRLSKSPFK